ncbi:hypothetical protein SKAU_G00045150 [Synaphobranchus kaupii]|uniref:Uncharacterized protein n=1 Tax=Synaphobranchus kaupii TaxID=118154 RepID=A0A9Q1J974_SYNKA|nr:hypothetical protein SKAU_G00045150 [Synaphobranchus kaupii]
MEESETNGRANIGLRVELQGRVRSSFKLLERPPHCCQTLTTGASPRRLHGMSLISMVTLVEMPEPSASAYFSHLPFGWRRKHYTEKGRKTCSVFGGNPCQAKQSGLRNRQSINTRLITWDAVRGETSAGEELQV